MLAIESLPFLLVMCDLLPLLEASSVNDEAFMAETLDLMLRYDIAPAASPPLFSNASAASSADAPLMSISLDIFASTESFIVYFVVDADGC